MFHRKFIDQRIKSKFIANDINVIVLVGVGGKNSLKQIAFLLILFIVV